MSERPARSGAATALLAALALALVVWAAILWSSVRQDPGPGGWLTGLFGGGLAALMLAGAGAWAVMLFVLRPARRIVEREDAVYEADDDLGRILGELEIARLDTQRRINASAAWRIPLCLLAAVGLWVVSQATDDPADSGDLLAFLAMGAVGGYLWASWSLGEAYRKTFKARVLPKLAAGFGPLAWRPAEPPLDDIRRLFPAFDSCEAEDEIHGDYRGLPLSIVELKLTRRRGKNTVTVFRGLTAAVTLPRGLAGTTVVVPDRGPFGNLARSLREGALQPVRLEDPAFEKAYEVYGADQIAARALLTPAFMERFMAMAGSGRFGAPVALVRDNRLLMALETLGDRNLFEPPSYRKPAAGRAALTQMREDIAAVLKAADAVIDLDQAARLQPPP